MLLPKTRTKPVKHQTKSDGDRIRKFERLGCIACRKDGRPEKVGYDVHHITDNGRRLGHLYTIPLCPWHHRGYVECKPEYVTDDDIHRDVPSLAKSKRDFVAKYGSEMDLWVEVNELLDASDRGVLKV